MAKVSSKSQPGLLHVFRKGICAAFSPKKNTLAIGGGTDVVFFDCVTGEELLRTGKTEDKKGNIGGIVYSGDGKRIALTHMNGFVSICDTRTGLRLHRLASAPSDHMGLACLTGTGMLAHAGREREIRVWDWKSGKAAQSLCTLSTIKHFVVAPRSGQIIAAIGGFRNHRVCTIDATSGAVMSEFEVPTDIWQLAVSPDESTVGIGAFQNCYFYNLANGKKVGQCPGSEERVYWSIAFSPDGKFVLTGSLGKLTVWRRQKITKVYELETGTGRLLDIVLSPTGNLLAIPAYSKTLLFDFARLTAP